MFLVLLSLAIMGISLLVEELTNDVFYGTLAGLITASLGVLIMALDEGVL